MPNGFPSLLLPNLKTSMELRGGHSQGTGEVGTPILIKHSHKDLILDPSMLLS